MAVTRAESIINADLRASELNLENLGLDSLEPILPLLAMMPRLKSLRLANNKLTGLPDDLASIRQLDSLDLSGNPVTGLTTIMRGLYNLVVLRHLSVDLPFTNEEDELIIALPSLESLNGTSLTETCYEEEAMNERELERAGTTTHSQARNDLPQSSSSPPSSHERPLTQPIRRPHHTLTNNNNNEFVDNDDGEGGSNGLDGVNATRNLFACVAEATGDASGQREFDTYLASVVRHLSTLTTGETDAAVREGETLKAQRILHEYCMDELCRTAARHDAVLGRALSAVTRAQTLLYERYDSLWRRIADDRNERVGVMKRDMQDAIREIESLMGQVGQTSGASADQAETQRLREEVGWLRTENERLTTRLRLIDGSPKLLALQTASAARRTSVERSPASPSKSQTSALRGKVLTLKQLKTAIEDIYASKSKYDIKCSESHLPRETMEQHMYTYLNQRYGLKHLILDWATAVINGIKKYGPDDNDVAVFGKILRNEIDEEFRFVQRQVRETVHELLRVYVKGKYPSKSDIEINRLVQKKTSGSLLEDEWVDIVKYMYNAQDAVSIILRVRDYLRQTSQPRRRRVIQRGQEPPEDAAQLSYVDLIRILLDFQVEGHDRFLARFLRIFRQHDADRNGIINEQEFIAVVRGVDSDKTDEEIQAVLELIDPYGNQLITYSECVTYLSAEIVKMMKANDNCHNSVTVNMA